MRTNLLAMLLAVLAIGMPTAFAQDDFDLEFEPETDGDRLAEAIDSGSVSAVRRLLDSGVSPNTMIYETPSLHWAIWDERYYVVKLMIDRGADVNQAEEDGYTAVMAACSVANEKLVKLLLEKGAKLNQVESTYGMSELQSACEGGNVKIVELLLERGVKLEHKDKYGGNCLEEAAFSGSNEVVKLLQTKGLTTKWPLHVACGVGDLEEVKKLIAAGKEIDKSNDGWQNTPLHFAVGGGHLPVAKLLLKKGASLDSKNVLGATLLHVAAGYDQLDLAKWLVEQGADINAKDNEGSTPLDWSGEETSTYLEELGAEWGEWEEEDESEAETIEIS